MTHEARQLLQIAPVAVDLTHRALDYNGALDFDTSLIALRLHIQAESAVDGIAPG